mgnify:CR=1 FL=1
MRCAPVAASAVASTIRSSASRADWDSVSTSCTIVSPRASHAITKGRITDRGAYVLGGPGPDHLLPAGSYTVKGAQALDVKWDDELVKATALTRDGAVIHPNFQPKGP